MRAVQHSIVVELDAQYEIVERVVIDKLGATRDDNGTLRALIQGDPSTDGSMTFSAAPEPKNPLRTILTVEATTDLQLPYFNGIVASMIQLHYDKAATHAIDRIKYEITGNMDAPEPDAPKAIPMLPPVPYTKEQAIYLATAGFAVAVATFGQAIVGQYGSPIKKSFTHVGTLHGVVKTLPLSDHAFSNMLSIMRAGALVALIAGGLADRIGRRRVILYSLFGMAATNLLSAFAPNIETLTVLQTLARGFATAAAIVGAVGALEEAPERARAFATTMLALAGGVGFSLTVILLPISDYWHSAWRGLLVGSAASALLVRRIGSHLDESKRYERIAAVSHQRGRMREVFGPTYRKRFILMALIGFFTNVLSAPSAQLTNTYLTDVHHYSNGFILLFRFATTTAPGFIAIAATARLLERYGRRPVAMITLSVGAAVRAIFFLTSGPILWLASGIGDAALAIGALAIGTQTVELFPTETRGTSNGFVTLISVVGSVVGLQVAGALRDPLGNIGRSIAICAAGTFIAAILIVPFLPETNQRDLDDISPSELEFPT